MFSLAARLCIALLAGLIVVVAADDVQQLPATVLANEHPYPSPAASRAASPSLVVDSLPASAID